MKVVELSEPQGSSRELQTGLQILHHLLEIVGIDEDRFASGEPRSRGLDGAVGASAEIAQNGDAEGKAGRSQRHGLSLGAEADIDVDFRHGFATLSTVHPTPASFHRQTRYVKTSLRPAFWTWRNIRRLRDLILQR